MLKRNITYEDFNGDTVTEVFYFNLSKTELVDVEFSKEGGFEETLKRIIKTQDNKALISEFKKLILLSYGEKSQDGKRFIKSDALREEFLQTAAFDVLFMELATNDEAAAQFVQGVLPKDLSSEFQKTLDTPIPTTVDPEFEQMKLAATTSTELTPNPPVS